MRYTCYFSDGPTTDRLIRILREQRAKYIVELANSQKLRFLRSFDDLDILSNKSLFPEYICDYIKGTGFTLKDVFFGFDAPVTSAYSDIDQAVFYFLKYLPDRELPMILEMLKKLYPNSIFDEWRDLRPSQKFREVLLRKPRGTLTNGNKAFGTPGIGNLSPEAQMDLTRYYKAHAHPSYTFDTNCWLEYAEFVGISLHWLWNLKEPLYCHCQTADDIFDYYTMMQPHEKTEFFQFMQYYMDAKKNDIDVFYQKVGGIYGEDSDI